MEEISQTTVTLAVVRDESIFVIPPTRFEKPLPSETPASRRGIGPGSTVGATCPRLSDEPTRASAFYASDETNPLVLPTIIDEGGSGELSGGMEGASRPTAQYDAGAVTPSLRMAGLLRVARTGVLAGRYWGEVHRPYTEAPTCESDGERRASDERLFPTPPTMI